VVFYFELARLSNSGSQTPFLCDSFIRNSTPVYPGALRNLLERMTLPQTQRKANSGKRTLKEGQTVGSRNSRTTRRSFNRIDRPIERFRERPQVNCFHGE
jgi:hypothetical protein